MESLTKVSMARPRLADRIYEQILTALQSGELKHSERLHQERIAERLDVSRTPVREALMRLEREGIIVPARNGGFELRQIRPEDVVDIYNARISIEAYSAGYLAEQKATETLAQLRVDVLALEKTTPATLEGYYSTNREIHRAFVAATGNENLLRFFDELWNRSLSIHIFSTMKAIHLDETLLGHDALCGTLLEGDFYTAHAAMKEHIQAGLELQITSIK